MPESPAHKELKVECNAIHRRPVNNDVWQKANVENTTSAPGLKTLINRVTDAGIVQCYTQN